ncbi:unnamed protein product [Closterium sp. NIES-53]
MASLRILAFYHEGCLIQSDTWLDDLQLYLQSDSRDSVSLFDHTSGSAPAPPATADSATRSQLLTRDAATRLAIRNHLPLAECTHFGQHMTAQALYDAVVVRYSSPATATLGRLLLPYLFPKLSAFATVEYLVSHLRTRNARYRAALPAEFLAKNPPPMYITLYFIVTRLPDSLRAVRDHFLALDPTALTVDLLEQHLLAAETSVVADVGAASASGKRRSSKGKGGRGGGNGSGGGGGGSSGGGGDSGGGGGGGSGGGSGGFGGGGGGSGGGGGRGGSWSGGGRTGAAQRGGSGGGQRQQQQRRSETPSPQQLRASESASTLGASASAAIGASESAAIGASEFAASADALHTFTLDFGQVAASSKVSASGQFAASCSCQVLSHKTLLWHHRLGHPSLPRLRSMHSRLLVSGLPRSLTPLPRSPVPPCLPCVEGRQRATPHSSFPPTTAPLKTLHMDVWGPAPISGTDQEHYFLLVVDDYTHYTTIFPLRSWIPWIRATRHQLREWFRRDLPVLHLHSDRGGEFSSGLLTDFCQDEGIRQTFTLPASPQ